MLFLIQFVLRELQKLYCRKKSVIIKQLIEEARILNAAWFGLKLCIPHKTINGVTSQNIMIPCLGDTKNNNNNKNNYLQK